MFEDLDKAPRKRGEKGKISMADYRTHKEDVLDMRNNYDCELPEVIIESQDGT